MDAAPTIFCARDITVVVAASEIDGYDIALMLDEDHLVEAAVEDQGGGIYHMSFDAGLIVGAEAGGTLEDGDDVIVTAFLVPEGTPSLDIKVPTASWAADGREFVLDSAPPVLETESPDFTDSALSLSGFVEVAGVVTDSQRVGRVVVSFLGEEVGSIEADTADLEKQNFNRRIDLRAQPSADGELSVIAFDACGFSAEASAPVKVVPWAHFRQTPHFELPMTANIRDAGWADWDGDGYQDVLLATNQGIMIAVNGGDANPGDFATEDMELATSSDSYGLVVADLDADGDVDLAVLEKEKGVYRLSLYRVFPDEGLLAIDAPVEVPISVSSEIAGMVAEDFTGDSIQGRPVRLDIAIATGAQEHSIVLFPRAQAELPLDADHCVWEEAATAEGDAGAGDVSPGGAYQCPPLFSGVVVSGGTYNIASIKVADVAGVDTPGPDGYPDLIAGIKNKNEVSVFINRYEQEETLETAFSLALANDVYPIATQHSNDTRYFCVGNFIEAVVDGIDHVDMVVGTKASGTWRLLRGVGEGKFANGPWPPENPAPWDVWSMSGTTNTPVTGMACADFDGDGHEDFAVFSDKRIMQMHLGDGAGRFNQLPGSHLLNPFSEGVGFVIDDGAVHPMAGDFDNDTSGLPDLLFHYDRDAFSVVLNRTSTERGFDMEAMRALVTPLDKEGGGVGLPMLIEVGDLVGDDGEAEIVAVTAPSAYNSQWMLTFNEVGSAYRDWASKASLQAPVFYVWAAGKNGPHMPSYPAAFDRLPQDLYPPPDLGCAGAGMVTPRAMTLVDLIADGQPGQDGRLDIVMSGGSAGSPNTNFVIYETLDDDLWNVNKLSTVTHTMFAPFPGSFMSGELSPAESFALLKVSASDAMPGLVVGLNDTMRYECEPPLYEPPLLKFCPWNWNKGADNPACTDSEPFWDCNVACEDQMVGRESGGMTKKVLKVDTSVSGVPVVTEAPDAPGAVLLLNDTNGSLTVADWSPGLPDPTHPWEITEDHTMGNKPRDMSAADLDVDGFVDVVATTDKQVLVAFGLMKEAGDNGLAFEGATQLDKDPDVKYGSLEGVELSDLNDDGVLDVVLLDSNVHELVLYLGIEVSAESPYYRRFHGPIRVPTCENPKDIELWDFDGDGCETLVVLCSGSGAVALVENLTCQLNADAP